MVIPSFSPAFSRASSEKGPIYFRRQDSWHCWNRRTVFSSFRDIFSNSHKWNLIFIIQRTVPCVRLHLRHVFHSAYFSLRFCFIKPSLKARSIFSGSFHHRWIDHFRSKGNDTKPLFFGFHQSIDDFLRFFNFIRIRCIAFKEDLICRGWIQPIPSNPRFLIS